MDIQEKTGDLTAEQTARQLGHNELAARLKAVYEAVAATPMALAADDGAPADILLDAETAAYVAEAAARLDMIGMVQQMDEGQNLQYTDEALAAMTDGQLAALLDGQSVSVLMDTGDPTAPMELNAHGNGCLERRLARECAQRLKAQAAKQYGRESLAAFVKEQAEKVAPFRPE
ncbi:MAG: hypothetical protein HFF09_03670 [Oscillospiraceae bacterium]|nr:hypothetical protein [Oscillospiraceae bacterium]